MTQPPEINPYRLFQVKKVWFPPEYFHYMEIPCQRYNLERTIEEWIDKHTRGRYYISWAKVWDQQDSFQPAIRMGFENHTDLTYFALACPYLKY